MTNGVCVCVGGVGVRGGGEGGDGGGEGGCRWSRVMAFRAPTPEGPFVYPHLK